MEQNQPYLEVQKKVGVEALISPMLWEAGSQRLFVGKRKDCHQGAVRTLGEDTVASRGHLPLPRIQQE